MDRIDLYLLFNNLRAEKSIPDARIISSSEHITIADAIRDRDSEKAERLLTDNIEAYRARIGKFRRSEIMMCLNLKWAQGCTNRVRQETILKSGRWTVSVGQTGRRLLRSFFVPCTYAEPFGGRQACVMFYHDCRPLAKSSTALLQAAAATGPTG